MITIDEGMNLKDDVGQKSPPGLVGLQNLGNTCYMNGALQALSNCQQLTRFLLDSPAFQRDKGLCHSYSELIRQIWDKPDSHYTAPTSIIRIIKCIYPDFRGCTQQDTQEFLRCFLEQLHTELKEEPIKEVTETINDITIPTSTTQSEAGDAELGDDDESEEIDSDVIVNTENNINNNNNIYDTTRQDFIHQVTRTTLLDRSRSTSTSDQINSRNSSSKESSSRSIISDIFEFKISSSVVCASCNNTSTTIEAFKDLSIPIPSREHPFYHGYANNNDRSGSRKSQQHQIQPSETSPGSSSSSSSSSSLVTSTSQSNTASSNKKVDRLSTTASNNYQLQQISYPAFILYRWLWDWLGYFKHWFWAPSVALDDCLSIFFGTDPLEGDNEYSCDVCNKKNKGVKYLKILELPEVLCIHFKRYESINSSKITTHVSFPLENLDLASYMCEDARPQCTTYSLISCICHHGSALLTGHYTTYALNCYDDQWYEFDDEYVTNVDPSQVEDSEAYILFYQKSKSDLDVTRQSKFNNEASKHH